MVHEHLKRVELGITTDEQEMATYRGLLAARLQKQSRPQVWRWVGMAAAAALLVFVLVPRTDTSEFDKLDLARIEAIASEASPQMIAEARTLLDEPPSLARSNAAMLLCLSADGPERVRRAAESIVVEPRPEYRFAYLELLLDEADEYELDADGIEDLMETEADADCLDLYDCLLRLAV